MAYSTNNPIIRAEQLGRVGDAGTRNDSVKYVYHYATADAAAVVEGASYFPADKCSFLGRGDEIVASMNNAVGQTPVLKHYIVTTGPASGDAAVALGLQTTTAG